MIERERAIAYGFVHIVELIDAELKRLGFDSSGNPQSAAPVERMSKSEAKRVTA
jgi:hypothetical protein